MKLIASIASVVTTTFLIGAAFIPSIPTGETGITPTKAFALDKPIQAVVTPLDSVQGIYLLSGAQWHSGCQSQLELVHQAADAMGMGDNWTYMQYIFSNESCVDPGRVNSIGARGLGQSLNHPSFTCGPGDIPCQLDWFQKYTTDVYGSWANAYAHWQSAREW